MVEPVGPGQDSTDAGWSVYPNTFSGNQGSSANGAKVAVVDTGILSTHPDLNDGRVLTGLGANCINPSSTCGAGTTIDDYGHGTHVAGSIAAITNNGTGVAGVAFNSSLIPVKVLNSSGSGTDVAVAKVVNLSLGGGSSATLCNAVSQAVNTYGVMVIAAAGNSSSSSPSYPAGCPGALGISATNETDNLASFSNFGSDVWNGAPGTNVLSTVPTSGTPLSDPSGYMNLSGTSMATPHVAALAALLSSQSGGTASVTTIKKRLASTADKVGSTPYGADPNGLACSPACTWNQYFGYGRINVLKALQGGSSAQATNTGAGSSLNPSNAGQSVTFSATVSPQSGSTVPTGSVQFKDNGANLGSPQTLNGAGQASVATSALTYGQHSITAAYSGDATFAPSLSPVITQTVKTIVTTSVANPSSSTTLSGTYNLSASATSNAPISTVEFHLTGGSLSNALIGTANSSKWGWLLKWNSTTVSDGAYTLTSRAVDSTGNSATSGGVPITVANLSTKVLIPSNGATLAGTTTLSADATGSGITSVEFRLTGGSLSNVLLGTASKTRYGWLLNWNTTTVPDGSYTLTSRVVAGSNSSTSVGISITVANLSTKVVVPSNGATISGTTTFSASATGSGITSVEFRLTGGSLSNALLGTATSSPYGWILTWNSGSVANGTYTLTSRVVAGSNSATSPGITITVSN